MTKQTEIQKLLFQKLLIERAANNQACSYVLNALKNAKNLAAFMEIGKKHFT